MGALRPTLSLAASALTVALVAGRASGSGFLVARFGGEHGHPATSHPSAVYYNPAGLALAHGTRVYVEGLFAYRSLSYDRPCGAIDTEPNGCDVATATPEERRAIEANTGKGSLGDVIPSPFFAATSDLGVPNLGVGLGFSAPFGGSSVWHKNDAFAGDQQYPGAVDGAQRWSVIEGSIKMLYFTAAGAYRIPAAKLSVGVGLNVVRGSIDTIRARTVSGTDDLTQNGTVFEGRSVLHVSGTTFSLGAGVIWQPVPEAAIGLSYQSQPGFGTWALAGTLTNKFGASARTDTSVDLEQQLPDVVRLGGTYQLDKLELRLFGEMVRWSKLDKQCLTDRSNPDRNCALNADGSLDTAAGGASVVQNVQRNWKNAFGVRGGASYWLRPNLELISGLGYDGNAVPDATVDASLIDMNKLTLSLGGTFGLLDDRLHLTGTYTHVYYFDRTVDPREAPLASPSVNPDGAGTYKQWVGVLLVGAEYAF